MITIKLRFLQLKSDLFNDPRIRKLKKPSNGYMMLVVYLRLLTLSLADNGYIVFDTHFGSLTEQLVFAMADEKEADIEATIAYCVALGLIQVINDQSQCLYFPDLTALTTNYKSPLLTELKAEKTKREYSNTPAAIKQRRYRLRLKQRKEVEKNWEDKNER